MKDTAEDFSRKIVEHQKELRIEILSLFRSYLAKGRKYAPEQGYANAHGNAMFDVLVGCVPLGLSEVCELNDEVERIVVNEFHNKFKAAREAVAEIDARAESKRNEKSPSPLLR